MKTFQSALLVVCGLLTLIPVAVTANDRVGFVGTGGLQPIDNNDIRMKSEDVFISPELIRVNYQYQNLTDADIKQTLSLALPRVDSVYYGEFADTLALINSMQIWSNGRQVQPTIEVRAYMRDIHSDLDVTQALKRCGLSDKELMSPWLDSGYIYNNYQSDHQHKQDVDQRIRACQQPSVQKLITTTDPDMIEWQSEIIYHWQQTFQAHTLTNIKHQYKPLLGGTTAMSWKQANNYCIDTTLRQRRDTLHRPKTLRYALTTANDSVQPIEDFTLTIKRRADEYVSLCWDGALKKINRTTFQGKEKNFIPPNDLNVMFFNKY